MNMKRGFSILEMSIVLMIIGLLIGGVLGAQAFLRNSELQAVLTDKDKYIAATNTFIAKYNGLPGDIGDATAMWGAAHATPATCRTTIGTGTQTCNGDGDSNVGNIGADNESMRYWQQLAIAGLIEGTYTGVGGSGGTAHAIPGTNVPKGKMKRTGYSMRYAAPSYPDFFSISHGRDTVIFGAMTTNQSTKIPVLTTEEAWSLDKKADDGRPGYGNIASLVNSAATAPGCATTDVADTAVYDMTTGSTLKCSLIFNTEL